MLSPPRGGLWKVRELLQNTARSRQLDADVAATNRLGARDGVVPSGGRRSGDSAANSAGAILTVDAWRRTHADRRALCGQVELSIVGRPGRHNPKVATNLIAIVIPPAAARHRIKIVNSCRSAIGSYCQR